MAEIQGGKLFKQNMSALAKKYGGSHELRVGFLDGATYPDGTSVAMVAAVNNFGAPAKGIPPRPFFSKMINEKSNEWAGMLATMLAKEGMTIEAALQFLGVHLEGELRQAIVDMNEPANSPVTNLLKQRFPMGGQTFDDVLQARRDVKAGVSAPAGKPLVQSGTMLNSVSSEVE